MAVWRDVRLRLVLLQILIVVVVLGAVALMVVRARERLAALGIHTGFGFLENRTGFNIGSAPPLPVPNAALFGLLAAVAVGIFLATLVARAASRRGHSILGDPAVAAAVLGALIVPSALGYLATHDHLHTFSFNADHSFVAALGVGMVNTLRVSAIALVLATLAGVLVALLRLSGNRLLETIGAVYVEGVRNVPLLLHLFFWYFGVLRALPGVRHSLSFGDLVFLNNRGLILPEMTATAGFWPLLASLAAGGGAVLLLLILRRHDHLQALTTRTVLVLSALALVLPPLVTLAIAGAPLDLEPAVLAGLNFRGGLYVTPEFTTLVVAMTVYHGAYMAEIIRAGILSVPRGPREAAASLALRPGPIFLLVTAPLALGLIIPPLIGRYLGLLKSSSLAVAIGYPEVISIAHSITFATGQAIELVLITMLFFLTINLTIALVMNMFNLRLQAPSG